MFRVWGGGLRIDNLQSSGVRGRGVTFSVWVRAEGEWILTEESESIRAALFPPDGLRSGRPPLPPILGRGSSSCSGCGVTGLPRS